MRSSLSDPDSPSTLNCRGVTVSSILTERAGRGARQHWFVTAPLEGGELLTCVFRVMLARDLETSGVFVIANGEREGAPARVDSSMRLCVSARMSDEDEVRSYRRWRGRKGG